MSATQKQTSIDLVRGFFGAIPKDSHYYVHTFDTQSDKYGKPENHLRDCVKELRDCAKDKRYKRITVLVLCDEEA